MDVRVAGRVNVADVPPRPPCKMVRSMRRLIIIMFAAFGAAAGAAIAIDDGWGVRIGLALIGATVGLVLGSAASGTKTQVTRHEPEESNAFLAMAEERDRDYWRDKGHPPFMKPPEAHPDQHMFDPDRQG